MSTAVGTSLSTTPISWSLGPKKVEIQTLAIVSGDTVGTITAAGLSRVDHAIVVVGSLVLTAAPTYSNAVVTLAFTDPAASLFGSIILIGV
jgi:hypothetical protein